MRIALRLGGIEINGEAPETPVPVPGGVRLHGRSVGLSAAVRAARFYRHGWQSWSPTWWVDPARRPAPPPVGALRMMGDDPAHAEADRHGGSAVGAVALDVGQTLLLGALDLGARVEVDTARGLHGACEGADGAWFAAAGGEEEVFARYAAALADRFGARKQQTPRVWCSWYAFAQAITEPSLLEVLDGLGGLAFDVFQVDDGWQEEIGDWRPNSGFPSGMDGLAAGIRRAGLRPGLWLAPFAAHARSRVFASHPEWFVRDDRGAPVVAGDNWGGRFHALDVTHPGARDYLGRVIGTAVGWGFEYLKLDFLYAAALPGRRHADVGREEAYRSGIELLREVAGGDVYLLACGAPVVASLGVFDGLRVGPDVAPWWDDAVATRYLRALAAPNTRYAIVTSLHRLWLQPVIDTDPDVAYFRSRYNLLDPGQRRWLQDLARVARFRATSDPPAWLDPDERTALSAFLTEDAAVRRLGPHRYAIGDREVDFTPVAQPSPDLLSAEQGP